MNITFLVGNGFDISAGIDTSYDSFYKWYCNQNRAVPEHVQKFKTSLLEDLRKSKEERTWADFELGFGTFTNNFTKQTISNFWECYDDAMLMLQEYIELQINQVSTDITTEQSAAFGKGLMQISEELTEAESAAISHMLPKKANENVRYQFISFNYTSILDAFVNAVSKQELATWSNANFNRIARVNGKVQHVHGQLNNNPLMGVGNKFQIANKELIEDLQQLFIKPVASEAVGELSYANARKMIDESNIVCLWGLSIGETDAQWWEAVMDWVGKSDYNHLIIFWYTKGKVTKRLHTQLLREKEKVCEKILGYSSYTNDQLRQIRKRIYVVFDAKNVLRVSLQKKRELTMATT